MNSDDGNQALKPLAEDRGEALLCALRAFDDDMTADFTARLSADRNEKEPVHERAELWVHSEGLGWQVNPLAVSQRSGSLP
ncbi:MAG: hypothetical protein WCS09_18680 [Pseudomonadota bacterium]|jgi:hypothetical protein